MAVLFGLVDVMTVMGQLSTLFRTFAAFAVVCGCLFVPASSGRATGGAGLRLAALSFHPRFSVVAGANQLTATDGRYALIWQESYRYGGIIIDQATGRSVRLAPPPGCDIAQVINPLGGRWALAGCGAPDAQSYELYDIATRTWRALTPEVSALVAVIGCPPQDVGTSTGLCSATPVAIGDQWIEFAVGVNGEHEPPGGVAFQNIWTGRVRSAPLGSGTGAGSDMALNLDSPQLTQKLCRPVRLPASSSLLPGTATIEGRVVISTGVVNRGLPPLESGRIYLQRCGSKQRIQIDPQNQPIAANAHAVLWGTSPTSSLMTGLLLPSLRRFTVRAPSIDTEPMLTERRLYFDETSHVWGTTTAFPYDSQR